jgi:8-oxo-dGTP pyrophosphatase MutT (NUDIX family)
MSENSGSDSWREAPKVRAWEKHLQDAGCSLESLEPLRILNKRDGDLLFALLKATGRDPEGSPLLPYALIRGPACVVVPVCRNKSMGENRFLMIRQRRIGHGGLSLEFPAGMLDDNLNDPVGVAVRELEEETGLRTHRDQLTPLWKSALFSSPGLSDESIYFFAAQLEMEDEAWRALEGRHTGQANEGEYITTTLKTFAEASSELNSIQPLLGFMLYRMRFGELR